MDFENPHHVTLDMRGYLDILFLPRGIIYVCLFDPLKTLEMLYNSVVNSYTMTLLQSLNAVPAAYARLDGLRGPKLVYHIPLTSIQGYSKMFHAMLEYYDNVYEFLNVSVEAIFYDGDKRIKKVNVNGGYKFLEVAIKGVL
jgi:hypothetical protein